MGSEDAINAIVQEVSTRIPTLEELGSITDPTHMGPDVTIPAIWMSLLLTRIRGLKAEVALRDVEMSGSLRLWLAPSKEDEMANYAGALAAHAVATFDGERLDAATVLFQAGTALLVGTLPADAVVAALKALPEVLNLRATLGLGEVRQ